MSQHTPPLLTPALRPGDEGFDACLTGYQLNRPHRPDLVVPATTPEEVRAAVAHARAGGLPLAVQSSGHGRSAALSGGVLVTTGGLDELRVDPEARTARLGAGVTWGQVVAATAPHGLAPVNGSSPGVGVVGYLQGGGLGVLAREFGWAADRVHRVEVVTGDARFRTLTAGSVSEPDAELFWALRGGGPGLGVVTGLEIGLVPLTRVWGGQLTFDGARAPELLRVYADWTAGLPDGLTSSLALLSYPDLPFLPEPLRGRYIAQVRIAWTGTAEDGEELVAPLRAVGPRALPDNLSELPYTESHTIHSDPPQPHAYDGDSAMLSGLDPEAMRAAASVAGPEAPFMVVLQLNHLGGALARPAGTPNAVGHRDAAYLARVLSPLDGTDVATVRGVHERVLAPLAPWTVGRSLNFVFGDHPADPGQPTHEEATLDRLARLRASHGLGLPHSA